jgi:hypothetical protein
LATTDDSIGFKDVSTEIISKHRFSIDEPELSDNYFEVDDVRELTSTLACKISAIITAIQVPNKIAYLGIFLPYNKKDQAPLWDVLFVTEDMEPVKLVH